MPISAARSVSSSSRATGVGEVDGRAPFDEVPGVRVVDERPQPAHRSRDDRRAARGRFERDETEGLGTGRNEAHVRGAVELRERGVGLRREEAHLIGDPELVHEGVRAGQLGLAVRAARTADDHQRDRGIVERGQAANRQARDPSTVGCDRRTGSRGDHRARVARARRRGRPVRTPCDRRPGATISMRSRSAS